MAPPPSNHEAGGPPTQAGPPKLFDLDPTGTDDDTLTVMELADQVGMAVRAGFRNQVWIRGELMSLRRPNNGMVYFDLTETTPGGSIRKIPVVLFRDRRALVNRRLTEAGGAMRMDDGLSIRIRGRVELYGPTSTVQIQMTDIDPTYTVGSMAIARNRLISELTAAGLINQNKQLAMPPAPHRIGLVTSPGSAAQGDFLDELRQSGFAWDVVMAASQVQGAGAEHHLASAIRVLAKMNVEVIAVVRGGGARTDLAAFDQAPVAEAIAASPVPVLTGVGHEVDDSVADLVAHQALKTPTACAGALIDTVAASHRQAEDTYTRLLSHAEGHLRDKSDRLTTTANAVAHSALSSIKVASERTTALQLAISHQATDARQASEARLTEAERSLGRVAAAATSAPQRRVDAVVARLGPSAARALDRPQLSLNHAEERLRLLNPQRLLAQGWSITRTADGTIVRTIEEAPPGTRLVTQVADGTLHSTTDANPDADANADAADIDDRTDP